MSDYKKPELLAPAGNYESFLCAVNAGADAVYLAGQSFGARAYADNFSEEEIIRALEYAHLKNKKIYMTVNTLCKNQEIDRLYDFMKPYYDNGLDGVIIQDFGVFSLLKENFPGLELHGSTQMTVTSKEGALLLKAMGASRVVPARELSLEEVKQIVDTGIETECFIHGSMCYCYSGQCLFSSIIGGRSGNRGRCAQPCRLTYSVNGGKEGYYLSLKDMCTLEGIPDLIKAGITSYKIEGRMKNPAYAAGVTEIYRRYIDAYLENPSKEWKVAKNDLERLKSLYIRSGIQNGYYYKNHGKDMITLDMPGYAKVDEGLCQELRNTYGRESLKIKLKAEASFAVNEPAYIHIISPVDCYVYGEVCQMAEKKPVSKEDIDKRLRKTGETFFEFDQLVVSVLGDIFLPVSSINELKRNAIETVSKEILKNNRGIQSDTNEFNNGDTDNRELVNKWVISRKEAIDKQKRSGLTVFIKNTEQLKACLKHKEVNEFAIPYKMIWDNEIDSIMNASNKKFFLVLPEIVRNNQEDIIKALNVAESSEAISGVYINQIDSLSLCENLLFTKEIRGDISIYQYNNRSIEYFENMMDSFTVPLELNKDELRHLNCKRGEFMIYGRIPLMNTANCVMLSSGKCMKNSGFAYLEDRKGARLPVLCHCDEKICYNTIYNSLPTSLHKHYDTVKKLNLKSLQIRFSDENSNQINEILNLYFDLFQGEKISPDYLYTNGHFVRGIE